MIRRARRPRTFLILAAALGLSVGAAPHRTQRPVEGAQLVDARPLRGELFHVQGLELDNRRIWVTSVDRRRRKAYLHEFDRASGAFLRRVELTDGPRYHPGGLSKAGGSIWIPVAETRPDSSALLVELDATTLAVRRRIPIADHIGCVAVSGRTLVAGSWDSRRLHILDLAGQTAPRVVANPSPTRHQDMKFVGGQLVAGGVRGWWSGAVDWIDWPSLRVARTLRAGAVGTVRPFGRGGPYTGEGLAIEGRDLYVVPEDGPSRLFHFRLDA
jgi:hypothetical protein